MPDPRESSAFREQIQQRLDEAQAKLELERGAMNHLMDEMLRRQESFNQIADRLVNDTLRPTLEALAE